MNDPRRCRQLLGSLNDYLDGELRDELCRELEQHLEECPDCRVVVDTVRRTISLYHQADDVELPQGVRERLFRRLDLQDLLH